MNAYLKSDFFVDLVRVLGHSIWLGVLAAFIYFFYFKFSNRFSPAKRVSVGLALILLLPVCSSIFAFCWPFYFSFSGNWSVTIPRSVVYWCGGMWLLGVLVFGLRLLGGVFKMHRTLARTYEIPTTRRDTIGQIRQSLNTPETLPIRVSREIAGPMLCGLRKPSVVLPETYLDSTQPGSIEAIVAHETAHYLRKDIWLNLGQSIFEMFCFFHPAVKWLSWEPN